MRSKVLLAALFVAGLAVSAALAAPAHKDRGTTQGSTSVERTNTGTTTGSPERRGRKGAGQECRPRRAVVLRGTFVAPGAGGFAMEVRGGNRLGRRLAGQQLTVLVSETTRFRKRGRAELADLEAGDRLKVKGRACTLDVQAMTLVAKRVVAQSPSGRDRSGGEDEGSTSG